jgi:hypothetical protein
MSSPNNPWSAKGQGWKYLKRVAGTTGLEPAASAVTGSVATTDAGLNALEYCRL